MGTAITPISKVIIFNCFQELIVSDSVSCSVFQHVCVLKEELTQRHVQMYSAAVSGCDGDGVLYG